MLNWCSGNGIEAMLNLGMRLYVKPGIGGLGMRL